MEIKRTFFNNKKMQSKCYLFCMPYAGASATVFRKWQSMVKTGIEVLPVHYPGHEDRIMEKPIDEVSEMIELLYNDIVSQELDSKYPFYLFGHSLGSRLAYELAIIFNKERNPFFKGLIVAGCKIPSELEPYPIYHLETNEFLKAMMMYGRISEQVISTKGLVDIFLPLLRADFKMAETYCNKEGIKVDVPILALAGTRDLGVLEEDIVAWKAYTTNTFEYHLIEGEHLFIDTNIKVTIDIINKFIVF